MKGLFSMVIAMVLQAGVPGEHVFAGPWTANLAASRLHKSSPVKAATLRFAVTNESVSITDSARNAAGQEIGVGTTTFRTDGQPHPHDALLPGLVVVARWRGSHMLETVLTRPNGQVDRVTYEVSPDGKRLVTTTSGPLGDQVIVFDRP